ncbi:MAG TPA: hypothetical protein VIN09_02735 [Chloroflexota bacterium]
MQCARCQGTLKTRDETTYHCIDCGAVWRYDRILRRWKLAGAEIANRYPLEDDDQ